MVLRDVGMMSVTPKRYTNFEEFDKDSSCLADYVLNNTKELSDAQKISYARNVYAPNILNGYIIIGSLTKDIQKFLECSTCNLKFSIDNMIKNKLAHPEVTFDDYKKIPEIIKNPSKYYKSKSGYDVILFKEDEKYYKLVIKTTKNRKENFIKSLHLLNVDRYRKY